MRPILFILLTISVAVHSFAQDAQFSQFFSSSIFINPAFAGLEPSSTFKINYKKNEKIANGAVQELSQFTFVQPLSKTTVSELQKGGIGITVADERLGFKGIYQSTKILVTGAYILPFDRKGLSKLSFGLQGGLIQQQLNFSKIRQGSQYNPYIGYDDTLESEFSEDGPQFYPIINSGVIFSFTDHQNPILQQNSFLLGISADYLNRPKTGKIFGSTAPIVLKSIATVSLKVGRNFFIHPSSLIILRGGQKQINNGLYISKYVDKALTTTLQIGTWYRIQDSFIALMGIQHKGLKIGASIDLNSSSINQNQAIDIGSTNHSFELSLSYQFRLNNSVIRINNPLF